MSARFQRHCHLAITICLASPLPPILCMGMRALSRSLSVSLSLCVCVCMRACLLAWVHICVGMGRSMCEVWACVHLKRPEKDFGYLHLLCFTCSLETVTFAEPRADCFPVMLAASKFQRVYCLPCLLGFQVWMAIPSFLSLTGCWASKLRFSCSCSKCSCSLSPLPSHQFALIFQGCQSQVHGS